jgi:hypothetical protein
VASLGAVREGGSGVHRGAIERIVAAANTAPSADNCQPWSFRWDGRELSVGHDAARAEHVINHHHHLSYLSLGCLLEALALAAGAEGLTAEARLDLDGPGPVWARVHFEPAPGAQADALAAELPRRRTDRRLYRGGSLEHEVFAAVRAEGAYARAPDAELSRYLADADSYSWRHPACYRDFIRWVRFSQEELQARGDGIPWRSLGIDLPELPGMSLARSPLVPAVLAPLGLTAAASLWLRRQLASSAAVVCFTVEAPGREALVAAGRRALRAWLHLTRAGYGVQPLTNPAIHVYNRAAGGLHPATRPELAALFRRGEGLLARAFGYGSGELPVWLFRAGLSPALPAHLRAPRRALAEIFSAVDAY